MAPRNNTLTFAESHFGFGNPPPAPKQVQEHLEDMASAKNPLQWWLAFIGVGVSNYNSSVDASKKILNDPRTYRYW